MRQENEIRYFIPALIQLSQIGLPDIDDGDPTTLYIDPQKIIAISRGWCKVQQGEGDLRLIKCTVVNCGQAYGAFYVRESCEIVHTMRERSLHNIAEH